MNVFARSFCAVLLVLATSAWADVGRDQAASAALRAAQGRVLAVDRAEGGRAWRVKIVTPKGDVRVVMVDAATGQPF